MPEPDTPDPKPPSQPRDPLAWAWHAACASKAYVAGAWFADTREQERRALAVCGGCKVRRECLAYALDHDESAGVWGGTTPDDRRAILLYRPSGQPRPSLAR